MKFGVKTGWFRLLGHMMAQNKSLVEAEKHTKKNKKKNANKMAQKGKTGGSG